MFVNDYQSVAKSIGHTKCHIVSKRTGTMLGLQMILCNACVFRSDPGLSLSKATALCSCADTTPAVEKQLIQESPAGSSNIRRRRVVPLTEGMKALSSLLHNMFVT
jgi:hypothetical protein